MDNKIKKYNGGGKIHHVIDKIDKKHNPVSHEDPDALSSHAHDKMGYTFGVHTGTETGPFPYTEENREFYEQLEFK